MPLHNNFISQENKKILWDFMDNNSFFSNIHSTNSDTVKIIFENKIQEISNKNPDVTNVVELNKKLISTILPIFNTMRNKTKKVSFHDSSIGSMSVNTDMSDKNVITAQESQQRRQVMFNKNLEARQLEFQNMIKSNVPTHVDFSDPTGEEDHHITNMEERMTNIINKRENDIKTMFTDPHMNVKTQITQDTHDHKNDQNFVPGSVIGEKQLPLRKSLVIENDVIVNDIILLPSISSNTISSNTISTNDSIYKILESIQDDIKRLEESQNIILEKLNTIKIV